MLFFSLVVLFLGSCFLSSWCPKGDVGSYFAAAMLGVSAGFCILTLTAGLDFGNSLDQNVINSRENSEFVSLEKG